jgi:cytochrome d ubiquinol oxidase subunit II
MELTTVWFILIATLWAGYFVLEGFDFGVGILLPVLGTTNEERRVLIGTIGPVWDGNEVWLIVAGGATFAAFPEWYSTLFSGFYLPLLLILVALILRGVAFEYRGKIDNDTWRHRWDTAIVFGSSVPAVLWGIAFGNILRGVPIAADHEYVGGFFNLLNPYALLAGATTFTLFALHGAVFIALKTDGDLRSRAGLLAKRLGVAAAVAATAFLVWTGVTHHDQVGWLLCGLAVLALLAGIAAAWVRREGWAFLATAATITLVVAAMFTILFPAVMPSSIAAEFDLTVHNAASTAYTLRIMTWVAVVFLPIVLCYQSWTYWIFRKRLSVTAIPRSTGLAPIPRVEPPTGG